VCVCTYVCTGQVHADPPPGQASSTWQCVQGLCLCGLAYLAQVLHVRQLAWRASQASLWPCLSCSGPTCQTVSMESLPGSRSMKMQVPTCKHTCGTSAHHTIAPHHCATHLSTLDAARRGELQARPLHTRLARSTHTRHCACMQPRAAPGRCGGCLKPGSPWRCVCLVATPTSPAPASTAPAPKGVMSYLYSRSHLHPRSPAS